MHAIDNVKLASFLSVSSISVASEKQVADVLTNQFWTLAKCRENPLFLSAITAVLSIMAIENIFSKDFFVRAVSRV